MSLSQANDLPRHKKPLGFYVLFLTEVWERFGFYTVSALLILYFTKVLSYTDAHAYVVFGAFSALLYITPAIGGYIADRFLGYQRTLLIGVCLLFAGYGLLAIPGQAMLYNALAMIVVGTGFFKSMPYALLTQLYKDRIDKIDSAFTFYYLSINVGGILPLLLGGMIVRAFGWHFTYAIAALGLVIGTVTFLAGRRVLAHVDNANADKRVNAVFVVLFILMTLLAIAACAQLMEHLQLTYLLIAVIMAAVAFYLVKVSLTLEPYERVNLFVAVLLTLIGVVFFALYYQQPMSLTLFIDRNVNHRLLGFNLPSSSFWVFNPIWILILGPCFGLLYNKLSERKKDFSIAMKFGIGTVLMGYGYFTLVLGSHFADQTHHISPWWIVLSYAILSAAELFVNALGTAMIAKLAPKKLLSVMMGVWFFGTAMGGIVAGWLAKLTAIPHGHISAASSLQTYSYAFFLFGLISVGIGLLACLLAPVITSKTKVEGY